MAVTVVDQQTAVPRAKAACKRVAEHVLGTRKVVVALVDDPTIAELHQRYLQKPGATDVLSFPHGEIVVSGDTARREAEARGIPPLHELVLYVVHGALHLAGYDDRSPAQSARMRAAERAALTELGYGDVFRGPADAEGSTRDKAPRKKSKKKRTPRTTPETEAERARRGPTRRLAARRKQAGSATPLKKTSKPRRRGPRG